MDRETGPDSRHRWAAAPVEGPRSLQVPSRAIMAGLAADPRLPIWIRRAVIAAVVLLPVIFWQAGGSG